MKTLKKISLAALSSLVLVAGLGLMNTPKASAHGGRGYGWGRGYYRGWRGYGGWGGGYRGYRGYGGWGGYRGYRGYWGW